MLPAADGGRRVEAAGWAAGREGSSSIEAPGEGCPCLEEVEVKVMCGDRGWGACGSPGDASTECR